MYCPNCGAEWDKEKCMYGCGSNFGGDVDEPNFTMSKQCEKDTIVYHKVKKDK
jgi:hypothetical protein